MSSPQNAPDAVPNAPPSDQELAMLRDLRVELNRKQGFDENHLLYYKGTQYDPHQERNVLGAGAGIIGLVAIGTCAMATVQLTKVTGSGGILLRARNWWISTPLGRMMDGRNAARVKQSQHYEHLRNQRGLGRVIDLKQPSPQPKPVSPQTSVGLDIEKAAGAPTKARILVQDPLPVSDLAGEVQALPTPPPTIQPAPPAPVAQPDWAKFQRREGKTINPSLQKAYNHKLMKEGQEPNAMKKWKMGFGYAKLTKEQKSFGSKHARRSFFIGSAITTTVVGAIGYGILSTLFGITSYDKYKDWMSSDENQFQSEVLKRYTNQWTVQLSTWLRNSWFNSLMQKMRTEVFEKETETSQEDHAIGDYFQAYASSWVGYQIDMISLVTFRPSRANNPSVDEILEMYQQPTPTTREEYEQEQLRILRQLAGLPAPPPMRVTSLEPVRPIDAGIIVEDKTPVVTDNLTVSQLDYIVQDNVNKAGV